MAGFAQQGFQEELQGPRCVGSLRLMGINGGNGTGKGMRGTTAGMRGHGRETEGAGAPVRIQMMTGTAAATFPISSSVCMIFLMRAWKGAKRR